MVVARDRVHRFAPRAVLLGDREPGDPMAQGHRSPTLVPPRTVREAAPRPHPRRLSRAPPHCPSAAVVAIDTWVRHPLYGPGGRGRACRRGDDPDRFRLPPGCLTGKPPAQFSIPKSQFRTRTRNPKTRRSYERQRVRALGGRAGTERGWPGWVPGVPEPFGAGR